MTTTRQQNTLEDLITFHHTNQHHSVFGLLTRLTELNQLVIGLHDEQGGVQEFYINGNHTQPGEYYGPVQESDPIPTASTEPDR